MPAGQRASKQRTCLAVEVHEQQRGVHGVQVDGQLHERHGVPVDVEFDTVLGFVGELLAGAVCNDEPAVGNGFVGARLDLGVEAEGPVVARGGVVVAAGFGLALDDDAAVDVVDGRLVETPDDSLELLEVAGGGGAGEVCRRGHRRGRGSTSAGAACRADAEPAQRHEVLVVRTAEDGVARLGEDHGGVHVAAAAVEVHLLQQLGRGGRGLGLESDQRRCGRGGLNAWHNATR